MAFICQLARVEPEEGDYTCAECTGCKIYTMEDDHIFHSKEEYKEFLRQTDV